MESFTEKIIQTIRDIPIGKVATYGQIARLAGNPRAARQVARVLHSMSAKYELPWHRVINAKGEIVVSDGYRQKELLEKENISVNEKMRIQLEKFQWMPETIDNDWLEG
ncbi:MGMT family protein [Bacillus sp. FJAT-50079]|uniref:MGMT family protein n=1 Tax=Bacillus sp. FJAT-50079 TaxID=2833577 RepID=UPI001BC9A448|nr:MGMT family protein [Bacillus sp. FJAT-50079]MBS4210099.1 MGMT family protein [Bacillus sp. FJAT-50079]